MDALQFLRKVFIDNALFERLYVEAERKQVNKITGKAEPKDFRTGFLMGFWLGQVYGEYKKESTDDRNKEENIR